MEATISVSGPFGQPIHRKKWENIGWNMKQVHFKIVIKSILKHDVPQHKDRNLSRICTTSLIRRRKHNGEVVDRRWLSFCPSQTCISLVVWCARIRLNERTSLLEKESSTGSTLLSAWDATSIQWNILMPQLHIVAFVINRYEELIQN